MSLHRRLQAALWLSALAGACGVNAAWAGFPDAHASKLHPWVLVALFWGVALVSIAIHHLAQHAVRGLLALKRYALALAGYGLRAASQAPAGLARLAEVAAFSLATLWATLSFVWEQHAAGARRALSPLGALLGRSRTAIRTLRA